MFPDPQGDFVFGMVARERIARRFGGYAIAYDGTSAFGIEYSSALLTNDGTVAEENGLAYRVFFREYRAKVCWGWEFVIVERWQGTSGARVSLKFGREWVTFAGIIG